MSQPPTISITSQAVDAFPGGNTNYRFRSRYTFTFSEPVTGFTAEDITVTNGTKGAFTTVSPTKYQLLVNTNVLDRDAPGDTGLEVSVRAGAAFNVNGNPNSPASLIAPLAPVINLVAADDKVNRQERLDGFKITGTGAPGAEIMLRFDSEPNSKKPGKQATVGSDGTWSIPITADDVQGFEPGEEGIFVYQNLNRNVSPQRSRFIEVDTLAIDNIGANIGGATGPQSPQSPQSSVTIIDITDPNTGTPLQETFDTVFRFSVTGSTPSSQDLQIVFGDGRTQSILTTPGSASGLPFFGRESILEDLQSFPIRVSPENGNMIRFQLLDLANGTITPLTISGVTGNNFTLTGGNLKIVADSLGSADSIEILTKKIEFNGEELEAINPGNLDTSRVTGDRITVKVDTTLYREAAFDNLVGFYLANKTTGAVVDRLTGDSIAELGDRNAYLSAVRNNAVLTGNVTNNQIMDLSSTFQVNSSLDLSNYVLLPFLVANGNMNSIASDFSNLYVASMGTNFDRSNHVQLLGNNIFGFEDLARGGDKDFDDIIVKVRGISIV